MNIAQDNWLEEEALLELSVRLTQEILVLTSMVEDARYGFEFLRNIFFFQSIPSTKTTGLYCDYLTSACPSGGACIATGPGVNHFESTRIIGQRVYDAASMLLRNGGGRELTGSVGFIHQFVDMPSQSGTFFNSVTNREEPFRGCLSAMGMSFGAGTMDGPGGFNFTQGDDQGNPFWEAVRDFL